MKSDPPSLRFDRREIGAIFGLFVFVAVVMFTVGVFVGRGLAQAKYEPVIAKLKATVPPQNPAAAEGEGETVLARVVGDQSPAEAAKALQASAKAPAATGETPPTKAPADAPAREPIRASADALGARLVEPAKAAKNVAPPIPPSFAQGKFTVQVGSYPSEKDASERVEALRKLGFPYAYFSAKDLGNHQETWFRVWLGYFPDFESAKRGGEALQLRGEVKNYLVRKTDTAG